MMNKYPSCRHCNQILHPHFSGVKMGWCPNCGIEIDEMKNLINEVIIRYDE